MTVKKENAFIGYRLFQKGVPAVDIEGDIKIGETYECEFKEGDNEDMSLGFPVFGFVAYGNALSALRNIRLEDSICEIEQWGIVEEYGEYGSDPTRASSHMKVVREISMKELYEEAGKHMGASGFVYFSAINGGESVRHIVSTEDDDNIGDLAVGDKVKASGVYTTIIADKRGICVISAGNHNKIGLLGDKCALSSAGNNSYIYSCGNKSKITASGSYSSILSEGKNAMITVTGFDSSVDIQGENSTLMIFQPNFGSRIRAKKGTRIIVCGWKDARIVFVDGETIKENVWYDINGVNFVEDN